MGRPGKLTPEVQKRFCEAVAAGNYHEAACAYAGIDSGTLCRWMQRGEREPGIYREFRSAVLAAQAEAETSIVAQWREHMPGNWQACRDFLARRFPERWADRTQHQVTGKDGGPIRSELEVTVRDPDAVLRSILLDRGHHLLPGPLGEGGHSPGTNGHAPAD